LSNKFTSMIPREVRISTTVALATKGDNINKATIKNLLFLDKIDMNSSYIEIRVAG
jgi:hypothetical protein